jgi:hypothetical protein
MLGELGAVAGGLAPWAFPLDGTGGDFPRPGCPSSCTTRWGFLRPGPG